MSETTAAPVIRFGRGREERAQWAWRTYFETSQRIRQELDDRLKEQAGLTVSDYNALLLLWEAPDRTLTMGALAKGLVFSPSRLNYRIKVLEDAGLVEKTTCADDRRSHNVRLTEVGARRFLDAARLHRRAIDEVVLSQVSDEELEIIGTVFSRIAAGLD
ncbi:MULTISPECIES: MarR family winged helix-turn-helix transcriptional regulator [Brevibacterium]|jgi:DNA-binding MarR family transcriptional regulator|uniref:MarR family transcriptional regulator n=1 Tax=Brevibacterium casei TaxID=33889 RepID=A0A7T3ZYT6_9MICO|nr:MULTISPECIES: MarR family transcriptional regulator [Brevibacterium]QQB14112.1 MarR family transcriptional regulator [Brevibacterium casei]